MVLALLPAIFLGLFWNDIGRRILYPVGEQATEEPHMAGAPHWIVSALTSAYSWQRVLFRIWLPHRLPTSHGFITYLLQAAPMWLLVKILYLSVYVGMRHKE
jgi:hypothetical protein